MKLDAFVEALNMKIGAHPVTTEDDAATILDMLYAVYADISGLENEVIRKDFDELYQAMNGKTLREIDAVINPVCKLCRDHEKTGFIDGVRVGIRLAKEVSAG